LASTNDEAPSVFPGARAPDRRRSVDAHGVRLAVYEWGDSAAPPLALVHGGFDFARTFDVFAPLLADAGFRVVSWDHRGHGDSQHAELYSWLADERDLLVVVDSVSREPFPVVGHSKGGSMLVDIIEAMPRRFSRFVAIDGLPGRRPPAEIVEPERTQMIREELSRWLDHRRQASGLQRKPGTRDELAERRARMNPRLSQAWLRYLVQRGAQRDADGWRWKIDPTLRMGGFGPWRWATEQVPRFPIPMLALVCTEQEPMGWGTTAADLEQYLPKGTPVIAMQDTGHFIHIERPNETAKLVLDFLAS
jgi:pimeloyl-ACP methyl ester carboxylesterase